VYFQTGPLAGKPVNANANYFYLFATAHLCTVHEMPDYPAAIAACTGRVNATTFDGAKGAPSFAPGTLLCQAPLNVNRENLHAGEGVIVRRRRWRHKENFGAR
jgi:hypothetical protein